MPREDIKSMIQRLVDKAKNPSRYVCIAPGEWISWGRKSEIQQIITGYHEVHQEQQREIERLKKELQDVKSIDEQEVQNGSANPA